MAPQRKPAIPPKLARSKVAWHRAQAGMPVQKKVHVLLQLQRQDLPLIKKRRALKSWEKPWTIKP